MNQTDLSVLSTEIAFDQTSIVLTIALLTEKIFLFINFRYIFFMKKLIIAILLFYPMTLFLTKKPNTNYFSKTMISKFADTCQLL